MVAMNPRLVVLLLFASLLPVCARANTILPDACGDDGVQFDVKTQNNQPLPAPPPAGKAQIVFIENEDGPIAVELVKPMYATVRFGLDGAWVGANYNNSYFVVNVDPGVHHLCVSWQSSLGMLKKSVDMASFTAEAGKVYYFAAQINPGDKNENPTLVLSQLDDDAGQYRVKAWKFATWKTNK
jgi:hypothetical protein